MAAAALRRVLVAVAEGSEEIEAVSIIGSPSLPTFSPSSFSLSHFHRTDTLRRAGAEVVVASVHKHKQVTCSRKTVLVAGIYLSFSS